jgi:hypothetical protein
MNAGSVYVAGPAFVLFSGAEDAGFEPARA